MWTKPILTDEIKEAVYKAIYDTFLIEKKEVLSLHRKQHNDIKMCICGLFKDYKYTLGDIASIYGQKINSARIQKENFYLAMEEKGFRDDFEQFKQAYYNNLKLF